MSLSFMDKREESVSSVSVMLRKCSNSDNWCIFGMGSLLGRSTFFSSCTCEYKSADSAIWDSIRYCLYRRATVAFGVA